MFRIASRSAIGADAVGGREATTVPDAIVAARRELEAAAAAAAARGEYGALPSSPEASGRKETCVPVVDAAEDMRGGNSVSPSGQEAAEGRRRNGDVLVATATAGVAGAGIAGELAAAMETAMVATAAKNAPPALARKAGIPTASVPATPGRVRPRSPTMSDAAIQTEFCGAEGGVVVVEGQARVREGEVRGGGEWVYPD